MSTVNGSFLLHVLPTNRFAPAKANLTIEWSVGDEKPALMCPQRIPQSAEIIVLIEHPSMTKSLK